MKVKRLMASIKYNLGSQRVRVKSTCRHLFSYGELRNKTIHFSAQVILNILKKEAHFLLNSEATKFSLRNLRS